MGHTGFQCSFLFFLYTRQHTSRLTDRVTEADPTFRNKDKGVQKAPKVNCMWLMAVTDTLSAQIVRTWAGGEMRRALLEKCQFSKASVVNSIWMPVLFERSCLLGTSTVYRSYEFKEIMAQNHTTYNFNVFYWRQNAFSHHTLSFNPAVSYFMSHVMYRELMTDGSSVTMFSMINNYNHTEGKTH